MSKNSNNFHTYTPKEVLEKLDSDKHGLSTQEAENRLETFGSNEISKEEQRSVISILISQFTNSLVYILLAAAAISFAFDKMLDFYVILGVLLLNAVIGFVQEYKAERALESLQDMVVPKAKVYRDGEMKEVPAKELVPGDIISIEEGNRVPADGRILEMKNLRVKESALTGESVPVDKITKPLAKNTPVSDRNNMVRLGTFITNGKSKAIVTATGDNTTFGKIAKDISEIEEEKNHFEQKADTLVKQMAAIAAGGAAIIFVIGYFVREFVLAEISLFTIAALVSGIPEGLPAVLAVVLAIGARRMASKNAIIRNMSSTETLGVTNTILTDKTGTLTENTMTIKKIFVPGENMISVTGTGWKPEGKFHQESDERDFLPLEKKSLKKLIYIGTACNDTQLLKKDAGYKVLGSPTEAALVVLGQKAGVDKEVLLNKYQQEDEIPFNTKLKYRANLFSVSETQGRELFAVGAPEKIIDRCSTQLINGEEQKLTEKAKQEALNQTTSFAQQAMRTLALAYKKTDSDKNVIGDEDVDELTLVGVVGMKDPARPGVEDSIEKAKKAGVRVVMCTGDHKDTALSIAEEIGMVEQGESNKVLTGAELEQLSEQDFKQAVQNVDVFARLTPHMKLKIAEKLQNQGEIVAMTGDGVNDAPALKKADIGISMGISGTDVAREASDIILADDNFSSIISAIEEGRIVFTNVRQASGFLVTTNFAEDIMLVAALLLGFPLPLLATQILWINLVTDGVSDVALAAEPGHDHILDKVPRKKESNILSKELLPFIFIVVLVMASLAIAVFYYYLPSELSTATEEQIKTGRTAVFLVLAFTQVFNMLNMRSLKQSILHIGIFSNKYINIAFPTAILLQFIAVYWLGDILKLEPLPIVEMLIILVLSSSLFWVGECYKLIRNRWRRGFN